MTQTRAPRGTSRYLSVIALSTIVSLAAIFSTTALLSSYLARYMSGQMLQRDAQAAAEFLNSVVRVEGAYGYFRGDESTTATEELLSHMSRIPDVFRANAYGRDGRVLWSSDPALIGRQLGPNDDLAAAMAGDLNPALVVVDRSTKAEHADFPADVEEFIELYIPIWAADGGSVVGAVEVYSAPAGLLAAIHGAVDLARIGATISGAVLGLGLLLVAWYSLRVLRRQEARLIATERLAVVGEMASAVAHGLRNPLAAIRSSAELMGEDDIPVRHRDGLHDIMDQVDGLESWIRSFLNRARSDPESAADPAHVDVILARCLRNFDVQLRKRGITVEVAAGDGNPVAEGGSAEIEQVLNMVIANAIEAMHGGGHVRIRWGESTGRRIEITVSDTGPGISEDRMQTLFQPFQTTKPNGLGVGLALGRRIAERLGGSLDLRNIGDRGVEARLVLRAKTLP